MESIRSRSRSTNWFRWTPIAGIASPATVPHMHTVQTEMIEQRDGVIGDNGNAASR